MVPCDLIILKCPSQQLMQHELKAGLQSQGRVVDCGMLVQFSNTFWRIVLKSSRHLKKVCVWK
jgi:hypothetical protein